MEVTTINAELFARMFLAGANNLEAKKEWINELNVFPVPDGDTGTNMSNKIEISFSAVASMLKTSGGTAGEREEKAFSIYSPSLTSS